MNAGLLDGYGGYFVLSAIVLLAHEPWRWLGFALGRNIKADGEVFLWVRAVATALVSGMVTKLVLLPAGTLASVPLAVRGAALLGGIAIYTATRRSLALGVGGGSAILALIEWMRVGVW